MKRKTNSHFPYSPGVWNSCFRFSYSVPTFSLAFLVAARFQNPRILRHSKCTPKTNRCPKLNYIQSDKQAGPQEPSEQQRLYYQSILSIESRFPITRSWDPIKTTHYHSKACRYLLLEKWSQCDERRLGRK